ncbi:MAG: hypothetical protein Unbinned15contig1001_32 [Prokaryotic dsDNA virus sp.]|nr:MAG: hypothetical protein Unbinned15contig1001_32 [Prokaryotic dsDNA virus sp.]
MNDCIEKSLVGTVGFISSWNLQAINPLLSFVISVLTIIYLVVSIKTKLGK